MENQFGDNKEGGLSEDAAREALLGMGDDSLKERVDDSNEAELTANGQPIVKNEGGAVMGLGTVKTQEQQTVDDKEEYRKEGLQLGYKNMPMVSLPSEGKWYPKDFELSFRAASLEEIKHYSSMDEEDQLDISDKINTVINSCVRIKINGQIGSFKDLKDFDKFYMLFAIRDLSMFKHNRENKIIQDYSCTGCPQTNRVEINNDIFGYFKLSKNVMRHYDEERRCLVLRHDTFGSLDIYIPSAGVVRWIQDYAKEKEIEKRRKGSGFLDKKFLIYLQFLCPDWRLLNEDYVKKMNAEFKNPTIWNYDKHSAMVEVSKLINVGVKPTIKHKCPNCETVNEPLVFFRRGFRSILDISSVAEDLFGE